MFHVLVLFDNSIVDSVIFTGSYHLAKSRSEKFLKSVVQELCSELSSETDVICGRILSEGVVHVGNRIIVYSAPVEIEEEPEV